MENKPHQQLTIILTLKDRTEFTYRWMKYMNGINCPYPILIADGGVDKEIEDHLRNTGNYPGLKYTYIRYPADNCLRDFYKKFVDVINKVDTPYLLFADNDDFFLLENAQNFIDFLNVNPDFVACGGSNIHLSLLSDKNKVLNAATASKYIATCADVSRSVDLPTGAERFQYFMKHTDAFDLWSCWYQVQRTADIRDAFDLLHTYIFREIVAYEIHIHMHLLFKGRYKELKMPFYIRQSGTSQMTAAANTKTNLIERFVINDAFNELHHSVDSFNPALTDEEKNSAYRSIAHWFANHGASIYAPVNSVSFKTITKQFGILMYQYIRSFFWPFRKQFHSIRHILHLKSLSSFGNYQSVNLHTVEKYFINKK